jgi:hypothetical protein
MNAQEWRDEMASWLEGFPWKWFGSLTFRPGFSESQARWRLRRWAGELRTALGTKNFEWVAIPEVGKTGEDFHFHVLIGGLCNWHAGERLDFMRRWRAVAGDARIEVYDPNLRGVRYILKYVEPNDTDKIEFHLVSRTRLQAEFGAQ